MNKYGMKVAACAIVGSLSLSGYHTPLDSRANSLTKVPAAGAAVALSGASTIHDLQVDVVRNISYLESASGLRPNIMLAAERMSLAGSPADVRRVNAVAENISEEMLQEINEAVTESESEITTAVGTGEDKGGSGSQTNAALDEESAEPADVTEVSTEKPSAGNAPAETDSQEEKDLGMPSSAGFSATDSYDDVKAAEAETKAEDDAQDFSGLVIARVSGYVNVRSMPSEKGEIVGKLYDKSVGEFIEEKDGWYKIKSGKCTGYVKGEYCVTGGEAEALAKEVGTTYAVVNTTTLKVRKEASTESKVLGLVPIQEELIVVDELDGWVKISIEEGDGYVSRDYVTLRTDFVHAESKEEEEARLAKEAKAREEARAAAAATAAARAQSQTQKSEQNKAKIEEARSAASASEGSEIGKAVIEYATQFVGNPYVYGGTSLTNGADCSGFVMSVYANFGVSLPHSSSALRSQGYDVGGLENAQPGDIVCYSGHVGLYVGNGQLVHASNSKTGIIISNASYRSVLAVRRIF